jgi:membrane-bound ClpP family serine protease
MKALFQITALAIINYFIIGGLLGEIGFNIGRIVLMALGGWYLVAKANSKLRVSAMVGIIVMIVDHIILKGGSFILAQIFWPDAVQNQGFMAFAGVLISFVMFAPIASLISLGGGLVGRKSKTSRYGGEEAVIDSKNK